MFTMFVYTIKTLIGIEGEISLHEEYHYFEGIYICIFSSLPIHQF